MTPLERLARADARAEMMDPRELARELRGIARELSPPSSDDARLQELYDRVQVAHEWLTNFMREQRND